MMPVSAVVFLAASASTVLSIPGLKLELSYPANEPADGEAKALASQLAGEIKDDFCKRRTAERGCGPEGRLVLSIDLGSHFCVASIRTLPDENPLEGWGAVNGSASHSCYFGVGDPRMHAAPTGGDVPL